MNERMQQLMERLRRGHRFVTHDVWHVGAPGERIPSGFITKQVRVAILLARGLYEETLLLRAAALTFATMLFIVPFLVFMFSFIQLFNLGDDIYGSLSRRLDVQLMRVVEVLRGGEEEHDEAALDYPLPEAEAPLITPPAQVAAEAEPAVRAMDRELWQDLINLLFPAWTPTESAADPVQMLVSAAERGATNRQALTIAGIIYLLTTVLGLMRNVEWSFNRIWGVSYSRAFFRTLSDYLVITLLLPFVGAVVLGIIAALENPAFVAEVGWLRYVLRAGHISVICLTFSLIYFIVPNTRVEMRYAMLGGIVAGLLWALLSWAYVRFQIGLVRYELFFSTFALFPLLLMWVYSSWVILLFGSLVSFAYQNEKTFALERLADKASFAYREAIAVRAMIEMARRFQQGLPGLTVAEVGEAWNVPTRLLNETMATLVAAKLAVPISTQPVAYQPARAPETTQVLDIVRAIREAGQDPSLLRQDAAYQPLYEGLDAARSEYLTRTLSELVAELEPKRLIDPEAFRAKRNAI